MPFISLGNSWKTADMSVVTPPFGLHILPLFSFVWSFVCHFASHKYHLRCHICFLLALTLGRPCRRLAGLLTNWGYFRSFLLVFTLKMDVCLSYTPSVCSQITWTHFFPPFFLMALQHEYLKPGGAVLGGTNKIQCVRVFRLHIHGVLHHVYTVVVLA